MIGLERCEQILKISQENYISNNNDINVDEIWNKSGCIEFINY